MSERIDLGQLHIEDESSGLSCTIAGVASFTRSDDNIQGLFESSLAGRLSSFDAWISTGGSIRLVIEAVLHEYMEDQMFVADIQRDLARLLSESTIWESLELAPSVTISQGEADKCQGRVIVELVPSIKHRNGRTKSPRRKAPYRLTSGSIIRDTKPPKDIALYATKEIIFVITVQNPIQSASKDEPRATASDFPRSSPLFPTAGRWNGYDEVEEMELDQGGGSHLQLVQIQDDESAIGTYDDKPQLSSATHSMYTPSDVSIEETDDRLRITTNGVARIIYEAIKVKMFSSVGRSSDIHVGDSSDTSCLADLFPSMWRPGFLTEVAARSGFIPSIGSSLAAKNTRPLGVDTGSIHYPYEQRGYAANHVRGTENAVATTRCESAIAVGLWKAACIQAFRKTPLVRQRAPRAACRLTEHENINAEEEHNLFEGVIFMNDQLSKRDDEDGRYHSQAQENEGLFWETESLGSSKLLSPEIQQDEEPSQLGWGSQKST